jgi:hypothetical protein
VLSKLSAAQHGTQRRGERIVVALTFAAGVGLDRSASIASRGYRLDHRDTAASRTILADRLPEAFG